MSKIVFYMVNAFYFTLISPIYIYIKITGDKSPVVPVIKLYTKISLKSLNAKYNVTGEIKKENNFVVYSNHSSVLDILILEDLFKGKAGFIAKKELKRIPGFSGWATLTGTIYMDRNDLKQTVEIMRIAAEKAKNGEIVIVFPEGTRSSEDLAFKGGSFRLAKKSKSDIQPISIIGADKIFKKGTKVDRKAKQVEVFLHDMINYDDYKDLTSNDLAKKIEKIVHSKTKY